MTENVNHARSKEEYRLVPFFLRIFLLNCMHPHAVSLISFMINVVIFFSIIYIYIHALEDTNGRLSAWKSVRVATSFSQYDL